VGVLKTTYHPSRRQALREAEGAHAARLARLAVDGPRPPGAVERPARFSPVNGVVWQFCMGVEGA
jgi:hypothetical protein